MDTLLRKSVFTLFTLVALCSLTWASDVRVYKLGPLSTAVNPELSDVLVALAGGAVEFEVQDARMAAARIEIRDASQDVIFDSGVQYGPGLRWECGAFDRAPGPFPYTLTVWDGAGQVIGQKLGELRLGEAGSGVAMAFSEPGDFTVSGYLGVGTDAPQRAVHLVGPNAVFRMDRSADTAAFILVRTDALGNPLKTFVVGANASGPNQGEFIINDIGAAVGGGGQRRMTISNAGDTIFTGNVTASQYFTTSSIRFKDNVRPLEDPIAKLERLRGVRFDWKANGTAALGVIAEEVAGVLPEAVSWSTDRKQAEGVNYDSLVALLIETAKVQQTDIQTLTTEIDDLSGRVEAELQRAERLAASHTHRK